MRSIAKVSDGSSDCSSGKQATPLCSPCCKDPIGTVQWESSIAHRLESWRCQCVNVIGKQLLNTELLGSSRVFNCVPIALRERVLHIA
jgi:hypothetical protein